MAVRRTPVRKPLPGAWQGDSPLVPFARAPGMGQFDVGGNIVDVRSPGVQTGITRTPVPGSRQVGPPVNTGVRPGSRNVGSPVPGAPAANITSIPDWAWGAGAGGVTASDGSGADGGDPWEKYLRMLDAREKAIYAEQSRLGAERARNQEE